jgi:hypothetical protein
MPVELRSKYSQSENPWKVQIKWGVSPRFHKARLSPIHQGWFRNWKSMNNPFFSPTFIKTKNTLEFTIKKNYNILLSVFFGRENIIFLNQKKMGKFLERCVWTNISFFWEKYPYFIIIKLKLKKKPLCCCLGNWKLKT